MKRGSVYIIPDENQILEDEFYREIEKNHLTAFRDFSYKYNLDYDFKNEDYQKAPCYLAMDGHLVVKIEEFSQIAILYIPAVVTDRQNIWIHNNKSMFNSYVMVGGYLINQNEKDDISQIKDMSGLESIIREVDRRNIIYNKRKDEENVGKKI